MGGRDVSDLGRYVLIPALGASTLERCCALVPHLAVAELPGWAARSGYAGDLTAARAGLAAGTMLLVGAAPEILQPSPPQAKKGKGGGGGGGGGGGKEDPKPGPEPKPKEDKKREILTIKWDVAKVYCGEPAPYSGTQVGYSPGEPYDAVIEPEGSAALTSKVSMGGGSFTGKWTVKDILPADKVQLLKKVGISAGGKKGPTPLEVTFIQKLAKFDYVSGRYHFSLSVDKHKCEISSEFKFVPGWGGQVVKLGNKVAADVGGLLDGKFTWAGYRWMKAGDTGNVFWDGSAWKALPADFVLQDGNNFAVGIYKDGTDYKSQYGGKWPEAFPDWDSEKKEHKDKLNEWVKTIHDKWSGVFDIKRKDCTSGDKKCCRYPTEFNTSFAKQATFADGMLIVAPGFIRANDALWFLDNPRKVVAAHEFGHHLANPDEYTGARNDTSLNGDGAVNGIDADSIMGTNMTKVKKRHFKTILKVFTDRVKAEHGKTFVYEVLPP